MASFLSSLGETKLVLMPHLKEAPEFHVCSCVDLGPFYLRVISPGVNYLKELLKRDAKIAEDRGGKQCLGLYFEN